MSTTGNREVLKLVKLSNITVARVLRELLHWASLYEWQIIRTSGQWQGIVDQKKMGCLERMRLCIAGGKKGLVVPVRQCQNEWLSFILE